MREGLILARNFNKHQESEDKAWATECALKFEDYLHYLYAQDQRTYGEKARSLLFNLSKNPELKIRVLNQELTAQELVTAPPSILASPEVISKREESLLRSLSMKRTDWEKQQTIDKGAFSGLFTCECGSERTGFIQLQIERADEPMTNFVYCYDCSARWKC